jgi:5-methylcytosine-specific restriction protein A
MPSAVPSFLIGAEYRRQVDIHEKYGGSWQNGISSSRVCPAVFVFTGETGEQYGYRDGFDSAGVFSYSGEG